MLVVAARAGARLDRFLAASPRAVSRPSCSDGSSAAASPSTARRAPASAHAARGRPRRRSTRAADGDRGASPTPASSSTSCTSTTTSSWSNKPAGLVVHPARGHETGTLVNGLLARGSSGARSWPRRPATPSGEHVRPGIVHRLDKGTSGVMVVARTPSAREALKAQFQAHSIERAYEAIVVGDAPSRGRSRRSTGAIRSDRLRFTTRVLRGKRAVTHVRVLAPLAGATPRRVHARDRADAPDSRAPRRERHAGARRPGLRGSPEGSRASAPSRGGSGTRRCTPVSSGFVHPRTGARLRFEAPPPADFVAALAALRG